MNDSHNSILDLYEDSFEKNFFQIMLDSESPNLNENFGDEQKNINNENNNNSFKIKIIFEENTINDKSTKEKTEQEIEQEKEIEQKKEKEKEIERQIIYVPKFKITNKNESNEDINQVSQKKRGRTNTGKSKIIHNKYSDDNLRRKCKHLVLQNLMKFINDKIKEIYGHIGYGMKIKKLLIINQEQISNATIKFNKNFLSKKLSEIFSVNISTRYTNFDKEHNKILISELINDKDEIKRNYFKMLFNLTFVDCLRHFNGSKNIQILNDMTLFSQLDIEDEKDEDYSKLLSFYINNYEKIMERKREQKDE